MDQPERRREDEWFLLNEAKLIEAARRSRDEREAQRAAQEKAEERERLKALHFMRCPKCGHQMVEQDFSGVVVERCSYCEGVFFDADELEDAFLRKGEERRSVFRRILGI